MRLRLLSLPLVIGLAFGLTACPVKPDNARDAIATAKGFLDSEAKAHAECASGLVNQACDLITRGNAAKHVAIDALNQYCAGPDFDAGGACHAPQTKNMQELLGNQLKAAIHNLNLIVSDLRALKGGK